MRELLEASQLPEDIGELLEPGRLPPEEEGRILALALARAGLEPPPVEGKERPTMKKRHFGLMLLVGVLCAGAVVGSAAVYFRMDRGLARAIGAGEEDPLGGNSIQTSAVSQGWTMTVSQAVGDRSCAYLLLEVEAPEGTALDADYYLLDDCQPVFERDRGGSWGWRNMEDDDKSDNRITFLLEMNMSSDLRNAQGVLKARGVQAVWFDPEEKGNDEVERLVEAGWEIPFRMDYQDDPVVYRPNQSVPIQKGLITGTVTVKRVELTPLSARVSLSSDEGILRRVEPVTGGTPAEGAILLALRDRQGELIPVDSTRSETRGLPVGQTRDEVLTFRPVIDPADVAAVVLDGVEIPLE